MNRRIRKGAADLVRVLALAAVGYALGRAYEYVGGGIGAALVLASCFLLGAGLGMYGLWRKHPGQL